MSTDRKGMIGSRLRLSVMSCMVLAILGQVVGAHFDGPPSIDSTPATDPMPYTAVVAAERLEVFDNASEQSYVVGAMSRGDTVRVRDATANGWLAIDAPPTTICWIEQSALERHAGRAGDDGHVVDVKPTSKAPGTRAWVSVAAADIRFGNPQARMPGPPRSQLSQGTMVRLVDRPPLKVGTGPTATVWYAIVPPPDLACYIRSEGIRKIESAPAPATEIRASYVAAQAVHSPAARPKSAGLPPDVTAEIRSVESMVESIKKSRPIEQWQFESARSRYQALLKRAGENSAVLEAIRLRLADLTRFEQAAAAAHQIDAILGASHGRDQEVHNLEQRLANTARAHARAFNAVGFVQPSARLIDGRKLYALIGKNGSTLAYLDVPPGLDVEPLLSHRVGVRGVPHYSEELSARLITVRDIETVGARR